MQRLFVKASLECGGEICLSTEQSHYLFHVLRMKRGETLLIFNGTEGEWEARISAVSQKGILQIFAQTCLQPLEKFKVSLFFAPLKAHRLEMVLEKATEIGITDFIPCLTSHTQVRRLNQTRLEAIVREAAEQNGRLAVPVIAPLAPLDTYLSIRKEEQIIFFCDLESSLPHFSDQIKFHQEKIGDKKSVGIVVGPEGGWSAAERLSLSHHLEVIPVKLGEAVLRAETASFVALTLLQEALRLLHNAHLKHPK